MKHANGLLKLSSVAVMAAALAACGGGGGEDATIVPETGGTPNPPANQAPSISGSPSTSVVEGDAYTFTPTASDPDGDTLTFSVSGNPSWMNFNASTGQLSGTPGSGDVGMFTNIRISVSDGSLSASLAPFAVEVMADDPMTPPVTNEAPSISGTPPGSVTAGQPFDFTPTASDPDGDTLSFSIQNRPSWLSFNTSSGQISGTPQEADVGSYSNIVISVSDGELSDSLAPFSVSVEAQGTGRGSVTLSWSPPTENTDGSPLTDLVGYAFYWGTSPGSYPNRVQVDDAAISSYVVDDLVPDTYYFVATAIKSNGTESSYSNEAVKEVL